VSSSSSSSLAAGIGFELSAEQRELRDLAHDFAEKELRPVAREWDEREDCPRELLAKAAALGLTSHAIPAEYGGGGVAAVTSSLIAEELSWGCAGLAAPIGATMFPVRPLLRSGTEGQKQRWLTRLASEEGCLAAIAFTEPGAGSDVSGIQASARRDGGDYVLSGEKCYVTNGGIAELTIVFAKLDGAITAFLVETGDPGVSAGRKEPKLGLRSSYTGSILFDEARLPADRLLGEEGERRSNMRPTTRTSGRRSASRCSRNRASPSSSPTWPCRSRPRGCWSGGRRRRSMRARTRACSAPTRRASPPTSR
jgi:alkylation response protein AidB-like acyl-CoA dehydrogenase